MSLFETSFLHINRVIGMWSTQIKVMSCFRDDDGRQRRRLRSENARRMPWIELAKPKSENCLNVEWCWKNEFELYQAIGEDDVGRGGEVDTAKLCGGPVDTRCHAKLFFALVHVGWNVRRGVWIPHASLRHRKIAFFLFVCFRVRTIETRENMQRFTVQYKPSMANRRPSPSQARLWLYRDRGAYRWRCKSFRDRPTVLWARRVAHTWQCRRTSY